MTSPHDPPRGPGDREAALPVRVVTLNQIVAYNMAYFRRAAGLSQEEFGQRLGGWSNAAVSAAERSWDGKRIRQFDADTLLLLAARLALPVQAFLLPPEDHDVEVWYVVDTGIPNLQLPMFALFSYLGADAVMEYAGEELPVQARYRDRYRAAEHRFTSLMRGWEIAEATEGHLTTEKALTERITMLRTQRLALRNILADLGALQAVLDGRLADVRSRDRSPGGDGPPEGGPS